MLLAAFEKALGIDVILENDVNLAVLGENWLGQGQGIDNLAFIAVGTGIGGGLMVGGQLVRGAMNAAGELGFLPFGADPYDPESLRSGAFERVVASIGIMERYRAASGETRTVPAIFERAASRRCRMRWTVLDETAKYLARGISAIAAIANPQKVIMGGSIGLRPELIERIKHLPADVLSLSCRDRGKPARRACRHHRRGCDRAGAISTTRCSAPMRPTAACLCRPPR
jgi:predicted NBD/HSP70 family sugar kinase